MGVGKIMHRKRSRSQKLKIEDLLITEMVAFSVLEHATHGWDTEIDVLGADPCPDVDWRPTMINRRAEHNILCFASFRMRRELRRVINRSNIYYNTATAGLVVDKSTGKRRRPKVETTQLSDDFLYFQCDLSYQI
jgi:hypothetical protein